MMGTGSVSDYLNRLVVIRNKDADEAGDYRVVRRVDFMNGQYASWEVTDIDSKDLDRAPLTRAAGPS